MNERSTAAKSPIADQRVVASPLARHFDQVRRQTLALAEPLSAEDVPVAVDARREPAKWHLAHTTWFFETFVLERHEPRLRALRSAFRVLFNSYYKRCRRPQHPRAHAACCRAPAWTRC